jgi:hypothetical protein
MTDGALLRLHSAAPMQGQARGRIAKNYNGESEEAPCRALFVMATFTIRTVEREITKNLIRFNLLSL